MPTHHITITQEELLREFIKKRNVEGVRLLLEESICRNAINERIADSKGIVHDDIEGLTPIHYACRGLLGNQAVNNPNKEALIAATEQDYIEILKLLVAHGADLHAVHTQNGNGLLMAVQISRSVGITQYLLEQKVSINTRTNTNTTVLHAAVSGQENAFDLTQLLLFGTTLSREQHNTSKKKAERKKSIVNDANNNNVLTKVTMDVISLINAKDKYGQSPLFTLIYTTAMKFREDKIIYSQNINIALQNKTKRIEIIQMLLSKGADADGKTNYLDTALHYAAELEDIGLMQALLKVAPLVNERDLHGDTPLHWTLRVASPENNYNYTIIKLLLNHGADPEAVNNDRKTPIQLCLNPSNKILELLVNYTILQTPETNNLILERRKNKLKEIFSSETIFEQLSQTLGTAPIAILSPSTYPNDYDIFYQRYRTIYRPIWGEGEVEEEVAAIISPSTFDQDLQRATKEISWADEEKNKLIFKIIQKENHLWAESALFSTNIMSLEVEIIELEKQQRSVINHFIFFEQVKNRLYDHSRVDLFPGHSRITFLKNELQGTFQMHGIDLRKQVKDEIAAYQQKTIQHNLQMRPTAEQIEKCILILKSIKEHLTKVDVVEHYMAIEKLGKTEITVLQERITTYMEGLIAAVASDNPIPPHLNLLFKPNGQQELQECLFICNSTPTKRDTCNQLLQCILLLLSEQQIFKEYAKENHLDEEDLKRVMKQIKLYCNELQQLIISNFTISPDVMILFSSKTQDNLKSYLIKLWGLFLSNLTPHRIQKCSETLDEQFEYLNDAEISQQYVIFCKLDEQALKNFKDKIKIYRDTLTQYLNHITKTPPFAVNINLIYLFSSNEQKRLGEQRIALQKAKDVVRQRSSRGNSYPLSWMEINTQTQEEKSYQQKNTPH